MDQRALKTDEHPHLLTMLSFEFSILELPQRHVTGAPPGCTTLLAEAKSLSIPCAKISLHKALSDYNYLKMKKKN